MKSKKRNKIIVGLGIGVLSTTALAVSSLSLPAGSNTKNEPQVVTKKKEQPRKITGHSKAKSTPSKVKLTSKIDSNKKQEEAAASSTTSKEVVTTPNTVESTEQIQKVADEKPKAISQENVIPARNIASASAYATTQYSHTTSTHSEGQTYSILATPVSFSGNSLSGTVTRTGVGAEKGSIVLNYTLNFDSQGRYLSGSITSSGYVTAQINLRVGETYTGYVSDVITTSYGRALSGSLLYPVRVAFNIGF